MHKDREFDTTDMYAHTCGHNAGYIIFGALRAYVSHIHIEILTSKHLTVTREEEQDGGESNERKRGALEKRKLRACMCEWKEEQMTVANLLARFRPDFHRDVDPSGSRVSVCVCTDI